MGCYFLAAKKGKISEATEHALHAPEVATARRCAVGAPRRDERTGRRSKILGCYFLAAMKGKYQQLGI